MFKNIFCGLVACLCVFINACTIFQSFLVLHLELPPLPACWQATFPEIGYEVCYPDENGNLVRITVSAGQSPPPVALSRRYNSFVVIYPLIGGTDVRLPPAGAIYPLHLGSGDTLVCSWEGGFAARLLERLWERGVDFSRFNTARFMEAVKEKSPADPWHLDVNMIAERLAAHDFTVYDLKLLPARDITFRVSGGVWFLESPFSALFTAGEAGALVIPGVSWGFHRLFQYQAAERLDLFVTEKECILINP